MATYITALARKVADVEIFAQTPQQSDYTVMWAGDGDQAPAAPPPPPPPPRAGPPPKPPPPGTLICNMAGICCGAWRAIDGV